MANHFYLTCPSNSSMELYPNNMLSNFKIKLNAPLELFGDYEVGLAEIQYPLSWHNIRKGQNVFVVRYRNKENLPGRVGKEVKILKQVPPGYYSVEQLLETMMALLPKNTLKKLGVKIVYNKSTQRVTINTKQYKNKKLNRGSIKMKHDVARVLGFDKETLVRSNMEITSPHIALPSGGLNHIYVYSDVVEENAVGDVQAPLLRVLPVQNYRNDVMLDKAFSNVYYTPVARKRIAEIEFKITDDTGRAIEFEHGKIVIVLHFQKVYK